MFHSNHLASLITAIVLVAISNFVAADTTTVYVRLNSSAFAAPYYIFSSTENGASETLELKKGATYRFVRTDGGHPFNLGSGWRRADSELNLTSTGSSNSVAGVASIANGQSLTLTIPDDFSGTSITYYCYLHASMVGDISVTAAAADDTAESTTTYDFEFTNDLKSSDAALTLGAYTFNASVSRFTDNLATVSTQDGAAQLTNLQYLAAPTALSAALDFSQTLQMDFRFKFTQPITRSSASEFQRLLLTTTSADQRDEGFTLLLEEGDDADTYNLRFQIGEGSELSDPFPSREGYTKLLKVISPYDWQNLTLIFRLGETTPKIDFLLNGAVLSLVLGESRRADITKLIALLSGGEYVKKDNGLDKLQLFLGGFPVVNVGCCDPSVHDSTLLIDYLRIQAPKQSNPDVNLANLLQDLTQHIQGTATLSATEVASKVQSFLTNFNYEWAPIATDAVAYLSAYETDQGLVFASGSQVEPADFGATQTLAYYLKQWIFDNQFVAATVADVASLKFAEASVYPGTVADDAPRISRTIEIDASYATDPAIELNNDETVLRPTGLYVAPGDLVEITVDAGAINQGITARVGLQLADLEATWTRFARFPRISNSFAITASTTQVANPFGGGLYFEVPDGLDLGTISVAVKGAVAMPFYSTLDLRGHSSDLQAFQAELTKAQVPWLEITSAKTTLTQPINARALMTDPASILTFFDSAFDSINVMAGRPLQRFRSEWLSLDAQITVAGTAMAASYPTFGDRNLDARDVIWDRDEAWFAPYQYLYSDYFAQDIAFDRSNQRASAFILWHEWGHLHNLPTLGCQEVESNVHLLAAVVYNRNLGADIDTALRYSGFQGYGFDDAALDTMLSPNWQRGRRLCLDPWDNEVRYQTRSWARIVEIASLLDWESVGSIHKAFYDRGMTAGSAVNYGIGDDDFILTASQAINLNLVPLFEFWGVPASADTRTAAASLPKFSAFEARLQHYRSLIPKTISAFTPIRERLSATTGSIGRWNELETNYSAAMGAKMTARVNDLLCNYYDQTGLCLDTTLDADADGIANGQDSYPFDSANNDTSLTGFDLSLADPATYDSGGSNAVDSDGDGVSDANDAFPNDASETLDTDGDGLGNNVDSDDDDDGYSDAQEALDGTDPLSRYSCLTGCFSFDIDQSSSLTALTDGLLVIRHLFGFSGTTLTAQATDANGSRIVAADISAFLTNADTELDIDGDGATTALTDGLLLIRYLFGFSGDALVNGAVGTGATRTTATQIETYINSRVPST